MKTPNIPFFDSMSCDKAKHRLSGAYLEAALLSIVALLPIELVYQFMLSVTALATVISIGIMKEVLDAQTPGRTSDYKDAWATSEGAIVVFIPFILNLI